MEKMREEFEAWHVKQCEADGMDLRDIRSELDRNGDGYVYIGAQYAWRGWKASRASLRVELPDGSYCGFEGDSFHAYMCGVESCKDILDEAGVSCK